MTIPLSPQARAALLASTAMLIAERDTLYDCISDHEGEIHNDDDRADLKRLDDVIDRNQAVLKGNPDDDPVRDLLDKAKQLRAHQFRHIDAHWWYGLQGAIVKVEDLYTHPRRREDIAA